MRALVSCISRRILRQNLSGNRQTPRIASPPPSPGSRSSRLSRHPELADAGIRHPFDGKEPGPDSPITGNTQSGTPTRPGIFTFQVMVGKTPEIPRYARVYVLKIEP